MTAIGPGDWVECVDASGNFMEDDRLVEGALYRVSDVFVDKVGGHVLLVGRERGASARCEWRRGYLIRRFRPVYRPRADLIESLLQPVDGVKPTVDA